ncbi:MAG: RNA polymerase sporulation sigma factor SigH [Lachnospiraceae bacterium]|nr:RNA polymerase sporulation sigma factor SigH [Lachnospiraceae bacterium]MBR5766584.1 RNA polymerase sporulation sigma factor SigH [Lachnospiraceae bacterium]
MNADKYEGLSDVELIMRSREGHSDVTDYLMEKYKDLVRSKARSMFILGADNDDLIQEGMIGLFKAVRDYDSGRDASFFTFAELCISRQIYTAVQASRRQKHIPLNNYISLYGNVSDDPDDADKYLIDALQPDGDLSPEELVIDKENVHRLEQRIEESLSPFEKQVLDLYITGMSYVKIAAVLGKDEKSTDNALQRLKAKIKKIIKEDLR